MSEPTTQSVTWYRWDALPRENVSQMLDRKLITCDRMMIAQVFLKKGCIVPKHSHENEQITYILEGVLRFWIGPDEQAAQSGSVRGHARPRRVQPTTRGLAEQDGRVPPQVVRIRWISVSRAR